MAEGDEFTCGEWKEKYMALETLLFKFRGQMTVIRELTAEKVSARRPRPPGVSYSSCPLAAVYTAALKIITFDHMLSTYKAFLIL